MSQVSGTTEAETPPQTPESESAQQPARQAQPDRQPPTAQAQGDGAAVEEQAPGFRLRGRARRRARFLRKARELAYRDLGGLVFNLHRFGQRNDPLVLAKLNTIAHIDAELRGIEAALRERRAVTVLREAGITACPRCAAIHSSEDSFCPNCGMPLGRHVDLPAGFQSPPVAQPGAPAPTPSVPATPPSAPSSGGAQAPAPTPGAQMQRPPAGASTRPAGSGRAPTPPPRDTGSAATQSPPVPAGPLEEEGPTEILRPPPAPGS